MKQPLKVSISIIQPLIVACTDVDNDSDYNAIYLSINYANYYPIQKTCN